MEGRPARDLCRDHGGDDRGPGADSVGRITRMMDAVYTLCGIIAVTGIVMGTIVGVLWLLGVAT